MGEGVTKKEMKSLGWCKCEVPTVHPDNNERISHFGFRPELSSGSLPFPPPLCLTSSTRRYPSSFSHRPGFLLFSVEKCIQFRRESCIERINSTEFVRRFRLFTFPYAVLLRNPELDVQISRPLLPDGSPYLFSVPNSASKNSSRRVEKFYGPFLFFLSFFYVCPFVRPSVRLSLFSCRVSALCHVALQRRISFAWAKPRIKIK